MCDMYEKLRAQIAMLKYEIFFCVPAKVGWCVAGEDLHPFGNALKMCNNAG